MDEKSGRGGVVLETIFFSMYDIRREPPLSLPLGKKIQYASLYRRVHWRVKYICWDSPWQDILYFHYCFVVDDEV